MSPINQLSALILAAGSSSRLGQPKQLLSYQGSTLISNAIRNALNINVDCTVVLGAHNEIIQKEMEHTPVSVSINTNWEEGIGNSLAFGMKQLLIEQPNLENILILLCDQIHITSHLLLKIKEAHFDSNNLITACKYGNSYGVPAIFNKALFPELLSLESDRGAKRIIAKHLERTTFIDFGKGNIDIDSEEDLKYLT